MSTLVSALFGRSVIGGALLLSPPSWTLDWSAPEGCPAQAEVQASLSDALSPAIQAEGTLAIEGRVRRTSTDEVRLDITFRGALTGARTLSGIDCHELTDAAILVIAIALNREDATDSVDSADASDDPEESDEEEQGPTVDAPQPSESRDSLDSDLERDEPDENAADIPARDEPATVPDVAPDPSSSELTPRPRATEAETRRPRPQGFLRAGGGASGGHIPAIAAVFRVEAGITGRSWRTSLGFSGSLPREVRSPASPEVGAEVSIWSLRPRGCHLPRAGDFAFPLCLGVELGAMRGRGTGALVRSETASSLWSAASVSAGLLWQRGPLGLWIAFSGTAAFTRPAFRTVQTPLLFRAGGFGANVLGGVELRLPPLSRG